VFDESLYIIQQQQQQQQQEIRNAVESLDGYKTLTSIKQSDKPPSEL